MKSGRNGGVIHVNSWNEYHESTIIEPTQQLGMQYFENTAEEAAKFCNGELGELGELIGI